MQAQPEAHRLVCKTHPPNLSAIIHSSSLMDYLYLLCILFSRTTTYSAIWPVRPSLSSVELPDLWNPYKVGKGGKKKREREREREIYLITTDISKQASWQMK